MINDDKPILRRVNGIWMACGSPWNGKHRLSENRMDPICGICVLRRGAENTIKRIDPASAMPILYGQIQRLRGEAAMERQMTLLSDLICRIPLYEMHCQPTPEAARIPHSVGIQFFCIPFPLFEVCSSIFFHRGAGIYKKDLPWQVFFIYAKIGSAAASAKGTS
jgi:hypothetical protein